MPNKIYRILCCRLLFLFICKRNFGFIPNTVTNLAVSNLESGLGFEKVYSLSLWFVFLYFLNSTYKINQAILCKFTFSDCAERTSLTMLVVSIRVGSTGGTPVFNHGICNHVMLYSSGVLLSYFTSAYCIRAVLYNCWIHGYCRTQLDIAVSFFTWNDTIKPNWEVVFTENTDYAILQRHDTFGDVSF